MALLPVMFGGRWWGVDAALTLEVRGAVPVHRVPGAPAALMGVVVCGELALPLWAPPVALPAEAGAADPQAASVVVRVVVVQTGPHRLALAAEGAREVCEVPPDSLRSPSPPVDALHCSGVVHLPDGLNLLLLDLPRVAALLTAEGGGGDATSGLAAGSSLLTDLGLDPAVAVVMDQVAAVEARTQLPPEAEVWNVGELEGVTRQRPVERAARMRPPFRNVALALSSQLDVRQLGAAEALPLPLAFLPRCRFSHLVTREPHAFLLDLEAFAAYGVSTGSASDTALSSP